MTYAILHATGDPLPDPIVCLAGGSIKGTYTASPPDALTVDLDASTVTCPEDDSQMELLGYLDTIDSWRFDNGGLIIVLDDGTELGFYKPY